MILADGLSRPIGTVNVLLTSLYWFHLPWTPCNLFLSFFAILILDHWLSNHFTEWIWPWYLENLCRLNSTIVKVKQEKSSVCGISTSCFKFRNDTVRWNLRIKCVLEWEENVSRETPKLDFRLVTSCSIVHYYAQGL